MDEGLQILKTPLEFGEFDIYYSIDFILEKSTCI